MQKGNFVMRGLAWLLCLSMVIGFVPLGLLGGQVVANAASTGTANMVTNGGFDNEKENWTVSQQALSKVDFVDGAMHISAEAVRDADGNIAVDGSGNKLNQSATMVTQVFEAKQYDVYELKIKYKWESGESLPYVGLWFFKDQATNDNCVSVSKVDIDDRSGKWIDITVRAAAPSGANIVRVQFGNYNGATVAYAFDNVSLQKVGSYAFAETFDAFNMLNGKANAKAGTLGWADSDVGNEGLVACYTGDSAVEGHALHFQSRDNLWAESPEFDVKAGYDYTVKFMAKKAIHNSDFSGYGAVVFLDADGMEVGYREKLVGRTFGQWGEEYITAVAPEGAVTAYLVFGCDTAGGAYGIDNLTVTESEELSTRDPEATDPDEEAPEFIPGIVNGDFEQDFAGWNGGSQAGATNTIVTDGAYSGKSALFTAKPTDTEKAINSRTQTIEVGSIKAFKLSVMSKRLEGENTAYIGLWFYDANGNLLPDSNTAFAMNIARTTEWKEDVLIQAVPEGATTVTLKLGNHSMMELSYLVDNVKLEEYTGPADAIQPATPSQSGGGGGGVVYTPIDPSELNTSFEELDASGWPKNWRLSRDENKCSIQQPADAPFGKNVLQITANGSGGTVRTYPVKAEPGKTYEVKLMAKDLVSSGARIGLYMFDKDGKRLDDYCIVVSTDGSGKWKMYAAIGVAPENVATIEAWVWYPTKVEAALQVDGLLMQESAIQVKPTYVPDPYTPPTTEELLENLSTEYPRVFFDGKEDAKQTKLRRFNTLKTRYGFSWYEQYNALLETAEIYLQETQVRVTMNTGKSVMMDIYPVLKDPSDLSYRDMYIENSLDENGKLYDTPYTGWGALFTEPLADRMRTFSLAYIMTGKTMYSERAISYAVQVAKWKVWGDEYWLNEKNLKAEASTGWMMGGMVAVYDMCYDQMTEEERHLIERSIIEKGLKPSSEAAKINSLVNGHLMQLGGLLSGCAAVMNESNIDEIKPYLDVALLWAHNALSNFAYSGNTEGHYYTDFGLETFLPGLGHLYRVTGMEELIDHPFLSEMLPYWTVMWADGAHGQHPNYSDGSVGAYMKLPMAVLSKLTSNAVIDGFLISAGGTGSVFDNFVYLNPDPKPEYLSDSVGIVEEIGYGVLRTGFATDDMMLTLKANDSQMGHNHFDQNSIQFNVGGNWLVRDPGAGSYSNGDRGFWTSAGHSTIMVDGNSQMIKGTASIEQIFNNSFYGYIVGSAPRSYGGDYESEYLTKFDRHAIQINHADKGYYMVIDDLESDKERVYTWHMFNGARKTFAVDGKEVLEQGSAQGNSVSVALGREVLNLKFVDGDKLDVVDYAHKSNGNVVAFGIAASSAAAKTHQFMTLISTDSNPNVNFIDFTSILDNRRFTVPEYFEEGDINWSSNMPLGQESVKLVNVGSTPAVFFRGNKAGDWISYPITIEEDGTYEVSLVMGITDGACQIKAYFDDIESKVMDCSGLPPTTEELSFGQLELTAGEHRLKIEVVGPGLDEDYEPGWYLIDACGLNLERVGVGTPPVRDLVVTETYDTDEALGALVNYVDNKFDLLMFNRTEGAATAGKLNTDAQQASVLGLIEGVITEGFAATNATALTYDGKVLFTAEKDVDIVASTQGWTIITEDAQTIKLSAVEGELDYVVTVNGETVDTKIENGELVVSVEAGETNIAVVVDEPEPTEPSEPATEPSEPETEPTEPETEPTEPSAPIENNNDYTLWIIVAAIVVVLAGAVVAIVLVAKKRKAAPKEETAEEAAEEPKEDSAE